MWTNNLFPPSSSSIFLFLSLPIFLALPLFLSLPLFVCFFSSSFYSQDLSKIITLLSSIVHHENCELCVCFHLFRCCTAVNVIGVIGCIPTSPLQYCLLWFRIVSIHTSDFCSLKCAQCSFWWYLPIHSNQNGLDPVWWVSPSKYLFFIASGCTLLFWQYVFFFFLFFLSFPYSASQIKQCACQQVLQMFPYPIQE